MKYTGTVVLGLAFGALAATHTAGAHSLKAFEDQLVEREVYAQIVNRAAPGFALMDAGKRPVSLAGLRGKVVVLNFVYASCSDVCPLHSALLASLQEMVNATPMRDVVQFVSITTDPERDTPAAMKAYGPLHGLDPVNWVFLTSAADDPGATRRLAWAFGLKFTPAGGGNQVHGVVTHVIDKNGRLRARYHGLKVDPLNILLHVNALGNEFH